MVPLSQSRRAKRQPTLRHNPQSVGAEKAQLMHPRAEKDTFTIKTVGMAANTHDESEQAALKRAARGATNYRCTIRAYAEAL